MVSYESLYRILDNNFIQDNLIKWGKNNFQHYAWRETKEPYLILIAEIMLHRTRAKQVVPVYSSFIKEIPTLNQFLSSNNNTITEMLSPLGLHWRIKKVIEMRESIKYRFRGEIPSDYSQLITLPGINNYIANAVLCFAFSKEVVLTDTNTIRVISRLLGVVQSDSLRRNHKFLSVMNTILGTRHLKEKNYALIDLAHLVCKIKNPLCEVCPLVLKCNFNALMNYSMI